MIIDILFSIIILITAVFGMRKGFIESFTDFLNLIVSICIALLFYVELSYIISKYISINGTVIITFSILLIFIATIIILRLITSFLLFLFDNSFSTFKPLNSTLGFILGAFKGIISLTLFAGIFEKYISSKIYGVLYAQSKILVFLEPFKDYIFK